ncbi:hypothetical protein BC834DRAFT_965617 [Gloeopeniophorella convolvens]|nr:hypothetical protein BC834DRAFT_965617 [Gloeopeniophorella convolvens]
MSVGSGPSPPLHRILSRYQADRLILEIERRGAAFRYDELRNLFYKRSLADPSDTRHEPPVSSSTRTGVIAPSAQGRNLDPPATGVPTGSASGTPQAPGGRGKRKHSPQLATAPETGPTRKRFRSRTLTPHTWDLAGVRSEVQAQSGSEPLTLPPTAAPAVNSTSTTDEDIRFTLASAPKLLRELCLEPFVFTTCESTRVQETPEINWSTFLGVFGGKGGAEEPMCSNDLGYSHFLCLNRTKQPFAPATPGAPGLLLRAPLGSLDDHKIRWHVLIAPCRYSHGPLEAPSLRYHGIYKMVTTLRTALTPEEWAILPYSYSMHDDGDSGQLDLELSRYKLSCQFLDIDKRTQKFQFDELQKFMWKQLGVDESAPQHLTWVPSAPRLAPEHTVNLVVFGL